MMKFFRAGVAVFFLAFVFSCKSTASVPEVSVPEPETAITETIENPELEIPAAAPAPEISIPEPVPHELPLEEDDGGEGLLFPEDSPADDTPEDDTDSGSAENEGDAALSAEDVEATEVQIPDPPPPVPPETAVPEPPVELPQIIVPPEEPAVPPQELPTRPPVQGQSRPPDSPPSVPPAVPQEPPSPPSFLGPAEPEILPPVREEIPVPLNPLPELPDRLPSATPEEQIVFSRVVRLTVGQILEIPFRGTGWVYLGELGNRRGITYISRRLDVEAGSTIGQTFILTADAAGTYILKFYKQDFIQDYIINDYVQVIVGERLDGSVVGSRDRVIAEPRWPSVTGPADSAQESAAAPVNPAPPQTAASEGQSADGNPPVTPPQTQTPSAVPEPAAVPREEAQAALPPDATAIPEAGAPEGQSADSGVIPLSPPQVDVPPVESPAEYVRRAREEFDAGRIGAALTILDDMKRHYPLGTDEALWLYGQLLEANSPARDIKQAIEYYRRLIREYPQSTRVQDAERRISYLERYYSNIR